jgi:hypothetical protein
VSASVSLSRSQARTETRLRGFVGERFAVDDVQTNESPPLPCAAIVLSMIIADAAVHAV